MRYPSPIFLLPMGLLGRDTLSVLSLSSLRQSQVSITTVEWTNHSSPGPQLGGLLVQLGGAALHARLLVCRGGAGGQLRGPRSGGRGRQGAALGRVAAPGLQRGRGGARGPRRAQGGRSLGPGARPSPATSRDQTCPVSLAVTFIGLETKDVLGQSQFPPTAVVSYSDSVTCLSRCAEAHIRKKMITNKKTVKRQEHRLQ